MQNTATQVSASQAFRRARTSMGLWWFIVEHSPRDRHLRGKTQGGRTYGVSLCTDAANSSGAGGDRLRCALRREAVRPLCQITASAEHRTVARAPASTIQAGVV